MDKESLPIVACANGYQFRAPVPVYVMHDQTLNFGDSRADGEYTLDSDVPQVVCAGGVIMEPIHEMPMRFGMRWRLSKVIYTGARRVILEVTPWRNPFVELRVPDELQKRFRCAADEDGVFFLQAKSSAVHSHGGETYGGDHIDMRGTVINGPFVAKTVTYDAHGNRSETVVGLQQSTIKLYVPQGVTLSRYESPGTELTADRPLRLVD